MYGAARRRLSRWLALHISFLIWPAHHSSADDVPTVGQVVWVSQDTDRGLEGIYGAPWIHVDRSLWTNHFFRRRAGTILEQMGASLKDKEHSLLSGPLEFTRSFALPGAGTFLWKRIVPFAVPLMKYGLPFEDWDEERRAMLDEYRRLDGNDVAFGAYYGGLLLYRSAHGLVDFASAKESLKRDSYLDAWAHLVAATTLERFNNTETTKAALHHRVHAEKAFSEAEGILSDEDLVAVERALKELNGLSTVERASLFGWASEDEIRKEKERELAIIRREIANQRLTLRKSMPDIEREREQRRLATFKRDVHNVELWLSGRKDQELTERLQLKSKQFAAMVAYLKGESNLDRNLTFLRTAAMQLRVIELSARLSSELNEMRSKHAAP